MPEDLDKLWEEAAPVSGENLDALWEQAAPETQGNALTRLLKSRIGMMLSPTTAMAADAYEKLSEAPARVDPKTSRTEALLHGGVEAIPFGQKLVAAISSPIAGALTEGVDTSYGEMLKRERGNFARANATYPGTTGTGQGIGATASMMFPFAKGFQSLEKAPFISRAITSGLNTGRYMGLQGLGSAEGEEAIWRGLEGMGKGIPLGMVGQAVGEAVLGAPKYAINKGRELMNAIGKRFTVKPTADAQALAKEGVKLPVGLMEPGSTVSTLQDASRQGWAGKGYLDPKYDTAMEQARHGAFKKAVKDILPEGGAVPADPADALDYADNLLAERYANFKGGPVAPVNAKGENLAQIMSKIVDRPGFTARPNAQATARRMLQEELKAMGVRDESVLPRGVLGDLDLTDPANLSTALQRIDDFAASVPGRQSVTKVGKGPKAKQSPSETYEPAGDVVDSSDLLRARYNLKRAAYQSLKSQNPDDKDLGKILLRGADEITEMLGKVRPDAVPELKMLDNAAHNIHLLDSALSPTGDLSGKALLRAIRSSRGKEKFNRNEGGGLLPWAKAMYRTFERKRVPSTGAALLGALGGRGSGGAAGVAIESPWGREFLLRPPQPVTPFQFAPSTEALTDQAAIQYLRARAMPRRLPAAAEDEEPKDR